MRKLLPWVTGLVVAVALFLLFDFVFGIVSPVMLVVAAGVGLLVGSRVFRGNAP